MEYKLIKTDSLEDDADLSALVTEALRDGWCLYGNPSSIFVPDSRMRGGYRLVMLQAVTKGKPKP